MQTPYQKKKQPNDLAFNWNPTMHIYLFVEAAHFLTAHISKCV